MKVFRDLFWYFQLRKKHYLFGVLLLIISGIFTLFPPYVVGVIVDGIETGMLTQEELLKWIVWVLLAGVFIYIFDFVWQLMIFGSAFQLGKILRNRLYDHFTKMSPSFYQKRRIGDLMAHSTNDVRAVEETAGAGILTLVDSLTMGGLVIATMATFLSWKLTLIALIPMPIMAWATSRYGSMLHKRFDKAQAAFSKLNDKVQENVSGTRVIKAFGEEKAEKESFRGQSKDVVNKNIAVAKVDSLFDPTISLIVGISFFLAIAFGARFVVNGSLTIGELTTFTIYLGRLIWPLLAFGWLFNIVERGHASYNRIQKLLSVKPAVVNKPEADVTQPSGDLTFEIETFTYSEAKASTLENIHIPLKKGETLGVVGKTGSGKTTLLKLLLREFDCKDGDVLIGGKSIYDFTFDALRSAVGYVPQDHFLFSATVGENIAFGKPDATMEEIQKAARLAHIHEDILDFEDGYETVVGERGVTLSGGQKQRISIARALLMDPEILILDDSLSAVDAETEEMILDHLRETRTNKTTMIAAHRLSAVEHADLIVVLEEGNIVEYGQHESLMNGDRWYAAMYRSQQLEVLVSQGGGSG
ncbi:MAG TPA: ABC transporter transmembrane domain-containing protein [Bacillales bacterium]|nr:ABC transporter transmembrane domain-containing protein [Bacillales bacterium]